MKNTQRGFIIPLLLAIIAILLVGGGVYVYENKKVEAPAVVNNTDQNPQNNPTSVTASSAFCGDFAVLSDFVLKNIQQPDSQNVMEANKNVITSIRWKRSSGEPFVSYPVINGIRAFYGAPQPSGTHDSIVATIKNDSNSIGQKIDAEVKGLGLVADSLNTLPFKSYTNQDVYLRTFGFRGGDNLYSIVLKVEGGGHQAPPEGIVTVACGRAVGQYDKVYNALNFKADVTVQDTYDNDYVAIGDVSADKTVYALLGSPNHIKIANYYYFDGTTAKLVSKDSYPAQCATLESQKVGQGMRCADQNYNQRTVTYTSVSTNNSQSVPAFSVSPVSGKVPLSVTTASFDVCQFNTIDWGDGSTAWSSGGAQRTCEFQNPLYDKASHTYTVPGTYTATLKNPSGARLGTAIITVTGTATQSSNSATPYIGSITPWSAPVGTTIEIRGSGLVGFEGDVYFFFKRSDGKIARLAGVVSTQTTGDATGAQTARVVLKEPCQQGQTVYGDYSGIPAQCDYVQLTPGIYKVYTTPWGKNSNEVQFTITN